MREEPDVSGSFLMLNALIFFGANEKWTVQVYDTKLMTQIDYQGHNCTITVGDK
jgi:hypothetical protein